MRFIQESASRWSSRGFSEASEWHLLWGAFIITWVSLFSWRPILFGFYHDDWDLLSGPASAILLQLLTHDPSRPVAVIFRLIGYSVIGSKPALWQIIVILSHLAAAITLIFMIRALALAQALSRDTADFSSITAGIGYLCFPWMLGTAWASGAPNMATVFLNVSLLVWFKNWKLPTRCVLSAFAFVLSSMMYEAYWFAFVPFTVYLWVLGVFPKLELAYLFGTLGTAQCAVLAFNRAMAYFQIGANKVLNPSWLTLVMDIPRRMQIELEEIFGPRGKVILFWLSVFFAVSLVRHLSLRNATLGRVMEVLIGGVTIAAGVFSSVSLFAMAGYGLTLIGLFARTSIGASWWLALAIGLLAAIVHSLRPSLSKRVAQLTGTMTLGFLAYATVGQAQHWSLGWADEQELLSKLPSAELLQAPEGSFLILEKPTRKVDVGFGAYWDTTAAIAARAPEVARHLQGDRGKGSSFAIAIQQSGGYWGITVTRGHIVQVPCSAPTVPPAFDATYSSVVLIPYPPTGVRLITQSAKLGCFHD
jgi:hypothetical protein